MAKILVVDDERSIRITLAAFLKARGHQVASAEDAAQALALMEDGDIDLVITDIILPRTSGVDLLRTVRSRWPGTRVIMMTGEPTRETSLASEQAGAFLYLSKPIGKEKILAAVDEALEPES